MGKSRMMGAGSACSTLYGSNVNLKTCGGNKKQGLPFSLDSRVEENRHVKTKAVGRNRDVVFLMNQLGGVSSSTFSSSVHSYASGDGRPYMMPFICDPYCINRPLNITPKQPDIPNVITTTLTTKALNIFSYMVDRNEVKCFTDTSKLKRSDLKFMVGTQTLIEYINTHFNITSINPEQIIDGVFTALQIESDTIGNKQLLKKDRVTGKYYSNPSITGFPYNITICSHIYEGLILQFPDNIITCPTINSMLSVGDSFMFTGKFNYNGTMLDINFNITIE
jgi:hypothetical protein